MYSSHNAGIMQSIVLGDRSGLDDDVKMLYQKNGISHILAISALHVSLVGMCIYDFLKRKTGRIVSACISTFLILSYLYDRIQCICKPGSDNDSCIYAC